MYRKAERKLQLRKETLRELESTDLLQAAGGTFSRLHNCDTEATNCGTLGWTNNGCPPKV